MYTHAAQEYIRRWGHDSELNEPVEGKDYSLPDPKDAATPEQRKELEDAAAKFYTYIRDVSVLLF